MVLQVGFKVGLRLGFFFFLPLQAGGGLFFQRFFNVCGDWFVQGGAVALAPAKVVVEESRMVARLCAVRQVAARFYFFDERGKGGTGCAFAAFFVQPRGDGFEGVQQFEGGVLHRAVALVLFEGEVFAEAAAGGAQAVMRVFVARAVVLRRIGIQDDPEHEDFEDAQLVKADAARVFGVAVQEAQFEVGDAAPRERQRRQFVVFDGLFGAGGE